MLQVLSAIGPQLLVIVVITFLIAWLRKHL